MCIRDSYTILYYKIAIPKISISLPYYNYNKITTSIININISIKIYIYSPYLLCLHLYSKSLLLVFCLLFSLIPPLFSTWTNSMFYLNNYYHPTSIFCNSSKILPITNLFHSYLKSINTLKTYYYYFIILIPNILHAINTIRI